jgi:hypothetical protein
MGLEQSRFAKLDFDKISHQIDNPKWNETTYRDEHFNNGGPFIPTFRLLYAGRNIGKFFSQINVQPKILEVCAGNGQASFSLKDGIQEHIQCSIISTDLYQYDQQHPEHTVLHNFDSKRAVVNYGSETNTLLLISPPPDQYVDYFAISEWEKLPGCRYVIYIGELGASDGAEGMYRYMLESSIWTNPLRIMISKGTDIFGGYVEKELFIFVKN